MKKYRLIKNNTLTDKGYSKTGVKESVLLIILEVISGTVYILNKNIRKYNKAKKLTSK